LTGVKGERRPSLPPYDTLLSIFLMQSSFICLGDEVLEIESVPEEPDIERLEKHTELINKYTEDVKDLIPLLNNLEDELSQIRRSLLIARDIMEIYDL
jgi:hypothetical protein